MTDQYPYHSRQAFYSRLKARKDNPTPLVGDPKVFFHVSCMPDWEQPVEECLRMLAHVGLRHACGAVIGDGDVEALAAKHGVTFKTLERHTDFGLYEGPTLNLLHRHAKRNPGGGVLYIHSKGASYTLCPVKRIWRRFMLKHVVGDWRKHATALREYDAIGCCWQQDPKFPHFSGNFWLARNDWVASLQAPSDYRLSRPDFNWAGHSWRNRMYVETWLGSANWHHIQSLVCLDGKPWDYNWLLQHDVNVPGLDWEPEFSEYLCGEKPVRWWRLRGFPTIDMDKLPHADWTGWEVAYDNDCEAGKLTSRQVDINALGEVFHKLNLQLPTCSAWLTRTLYHDPFIHGGGLHVIMPGGWLNTHLDYDRHPRLPDRRRAINLIAFPNPEWKREWGGALVLCDSSGKPVQRFYPEPGQVVVFETNENSYHGVEKVTGPVPRITVANHFLTESSPANTRTRALFMPTRGVQRRNLTAAEPQFVKLDHTSLAVGFVGQRYNAGIIEWEDGYLLAVRAGSFITTARVFLCKLDKDFRPTGDCRQLKLEHPACSYGQEDPRLFWFAGKPHLSFTGTAYVNGELVCSVLYTKLRDDLSPEKVYCPEIAGRTFWEKNHVYFDSKTHGMCAIYSTRPHKIIGIDREITRVVAETEGPPQWNGGEMRGGAPPVLVGDHWYHWFHGRTDNGKGNNIGYEIGCLKFENQYPFKVVACMRDPILVGKPEHDNRYGANVIFVCGAIRKQGDWLLSLGYGDRWIEVQRYNAAWVDSQLVNL